MKKLRFLLIFGAATFAVLCGASALFAAEPTASVPYVDYHYHVFEEKSTPQTALATQRETGIRRGVLENVGRDSVWVINTNADLKAFIDSVAATDAQLKPGEPRLLIGLQVNDRDWFQKIDLRQYRRLDYVLADAMYIPDKTTGKQFGLWELPKDYDADVNAWFAEYYDYCMSLLDEPIDIYANPTYLPAFAESEYSRLWTEERSRAFIRKAVENNVALEIQAASAFPSRDFVKLAVEMGAKFVVGTNNFDGNDVDCSRWDEIVREFRLTEENFWTPER